MKLSPFGAKSQTRVQLEVSVSDLTLTMRVLDEAKDWEITANVEIDQIKPVSTVAVCFSGSAEGEAPTTVRLVGSSAETGTLKSRRASKDLWDDDNNVGMDHKSAQDRMGSAELNT